MEAFFISPGVFSSMMVEETARDDAFPPGHDGSGSHRGHFKEESGVDWLAGKLEEGLEFRVSSG